MELGLQNGLRHDCTQLINVTGRKQEEGIARYHQRTCTGLWSEYFIFLSPHLYIAKFLQKADIRYKEQNVYSFRPKMPERERHKRLHQASLNMIKLAGWGSTLSVTEQCIAPTLAGNERRRNCRKAAGNPRRPRSLAPSPACDNVLVNKREAQ